jgi:ATP-dependent DNA helicase RecQ
MPNPISGAAASPAVAAAADAAVAATDTAPAAADTAPAAADTAATANPTAILQRHFGFPAFRPGQEELVRAAIDGRDAIGILPTGGGKSLCYQVPAFILPGLTLVVSPLVSLMADQVRRAEELGLPGAALHSGLTPDERARVETALTENRLKVLLVAPERFGSKAFEPLLPRLRVSLLTIDEAHCISMWGHDFRPSYRALGEVRRRLGAGWAGAAPPPILALTATATPRVRAEIEASLGLREPFRMIGGFDRENLLWAVLPAPTWDGKNRIIRELVLGFPGARLVYAATRRRVERIRGYLARMGVRAEAYHAGLPPEERTRVQEHFLSSPAPVVVATNAFGMGIDRPDVRLVVHDQLSGSLEDYYQEAGRAGRDGGLALCVALRSPNDPKVHRAFLDQTHAPPRGWREWAGAVAVWAGAASAGAGAATGAEAAAGAAGSARFRIPVASLDPDLAHRLARRAVTKAKLKGVARYAATKSCRRRVLLRWFGETPPPGPCPGCDGCLGWEGVLKALPFL